MLSGFTSVPRKFLFRGRKDCRTGPGQQAMTRALCCKQVATFLAILLGCLLRVKTVSQLLLHQRLRPIRSGKYHNNPDRYTYLVGERMG